MTEGEHSRAWSDYWKQWRGGGAVCLPSAPREVNQALQHFWSEVAQRFSSGATLLDVACGSGAVGYLLTHVHPGIRVVGIDFARLPQSQSARVVLHPEVRIEALPFADRSFDGAVSQYGIEYSDVATAAGELGRVLKPDAPVAFLVHHADGPIAAHNRARNCALRALAEPALASAFLAGDRVALAAQLTGLRRDHPAQDVVGEFATGLTQAIGGNVKDRRDLWDDLHGKLSTERTILDALDTAAVRDIDQWSMPFERCFALAPAAIINDGRNEPIAWAVSGRRRDA